MAATPFELREFFHLALLRHLGTRLSGRSYAVKGGICLRFFHRSPRLSHDMDLDIGADVRVDTLENGVDSVLSGRALLASLTPSGISRLASTKPKQTAVTQRWKVSLVLAGGESIPTKVEFSRRRERLVCSTGVPDAELLRRHMTAPFAARFYDAGSMAAQKIAALASPSRNAQRDFFDLHHLLIRIGVKPGELAHLVPPGAVEAAGEKAGGFTFKDFKQQVLPYLSGELIELYRDPKGYEQQKAEVEGALLEMLR